MQKTSTLPVKKSSSKKDIITVKAIEPKAKTLKKTNTQTAIVPTGDREAPKEALGMINPNTVLAPIMSKAQMEIIMGKTPNYAIKHRPGRSGKTFKYVTYGYVVAKLNQAFGFDWDFKIIPQGGGEIFKLIQFTEQQYDNKAKKFVDVEIRNIQCYGELTVRIHDPKTFAVIATITKPGVGSQNWERTVEYGDACKGAKSDCLKVAAHELGIGLDLYWDDSAELQTFENEQKETKEAMTVLAQANGQTLPDVDKAFPPVSVIPSINLADNSVPPTTPMELLIKAQKVFGLDGMNLSIKLGCSVPELMSYDQEKVTKAWDKLAQENKNGKAA